MFNLKLERYLLGELPKAEMAQMEKELKKNPDLRAQLERLRGDTNAYFAKYPTLQTKMKEPWWRRRISRIAGGALVFAAASACVVLLLPRSPEAPLKIALNNGNPDKTLTNNGPDDNGIRTKGLEPALFLTIGERELKDGDTVKAGDAVRIAYRASGFAYGAILSVDNSKSVTLHYPERDGTPAQLRKGSLNALHHAFELDEKPGFEKFFFIASKNKVAVSAIRRELERTGNFSTRDKAVHVSAIRLIKK